MSHTAVASPWLDGRPGLAAQAAVWQTTLPAVRRRVETDAAALATPRLWTDTIGSLASTTWRIAGAAAPDAPLVLMGAAARGCGAGCAPTSRPWRWRAPWQSGCTRRRGPPTSVASSNCSRT